MKSLETIEVYYDLISKIYVRDITLAVELFDAFKIIQFYVIS